MDAEDDVVRWDPGGDLDRIAPLWGEAASDLRAELAGLPALIAPVALVAGDGRPTDHAIHGLGGRAPLALALYVPQAVTGSSKVSLARFALPPGTSLARGDALIRWAEARARAERAASVEVVERRAPGLGALLEPRGFTVVNAMIRMRRGRVRSVPPLPVGLADVSLAEAGIEAWVRAHNESFAGVPFSAPTTREACERAIAAPGADPGLTRIVLEDADPVAFLDGALHADGTGEVRAIGVVPRAQGRGLGLWVLRRCEELLDARGAREVVLRVAETNRTARSLYEREGYAEVGRNTAWERRL